jgi:hypothetical protein
MMTQRMPCVACPWRVDAHAQDIPNFKLALAESLADTCPDSSGQGPSFGSLVFACHQSRPNEEFHCAGWLAAMGVNHPNIRLSVATGKLDVEVLSPGEDWPELHTSFEDFITKLRRDSDAL